MVDVSVRENLYVLSPEELEERLSYKEWRMNNLYSIVLEDGNVVPFLANEIQKRIRAEKSGKKDIILKYRQGGVSTEFIVSRVDDILWAGMNITSYFVTHRQDLLDEFFRKAKFTIDSIHPLVKPMLPKSTTNNANEIYFKATNNMLRIGLDVRGKTPTHLHISEFAHMTQEVQAKLFVAMESFRKCRITIESTANGMGDIFHGLCTQSKQGDSEYKLLFYGFDIDSRNESDASNFTPTEFEENFAKSFLTQYPREQQLRKLAWRRMKIHTYNAMGEKGEEYFNQENPITMESSFISSGANVFDLTQQYQIQQPIRELEGFKIFLDPCDELVIGVDIAEGGQEGDYSAISGRRRDGKVAFQYKARVNEIELARKLDFILTHEVNGKRYEGVIFPENNKGIAFINACREYKWFQFMLKQRKIDSTTGEDLQDKYGFWTSETSKDLIIREYRGAIYEKKIWVTPELYSEICTYQYDKNNRPNAVGKNHDDLLMADMIAYYAVLHEPMVVRSRAKEKLPSEDELEGMTIMQRHMARLKSGYYNRDDE